MKLTNEQLAKVKAAKNAEELLALAKENGMEMTDDEAKKYFADLHKEGELADDELDNVSGGGGCITGSLVEGGMADPKYHKGDVLYIPQRATTYYSRIEIVSDGNWCTDVYLYDTVLYDKNDCATSVSLTEPKIDTYIA